MCPQIEFADFCGSGFAGYSNKGNSGNNTFGTTLTAKKKKADPRLVSQTGELPQDARMQSLSVLRLKAISAALNLIHNLVDANGPLYYGDYEKCRANSYGTAFAALTATVTAVTSNCSSGSPVVNEITMCSSESKRVGKDGANKSHCEVC